MFVCFSNQVEEAQLAELEWHLQYPTRSWQKVFDWFSVKPLSKECLNSIWYNLILRLSSFSSLQSRNPIIWKSEFKLMAMKKLSRSRANCPRCSAYLFSGIWSMSMDISEKDERAPQMSVCHSNAQRPREMATRPQVSDRKKQYLVFIPQRGLSGSFFLALANYCDLKGLRL